jgi:putative serine protease PepD
MSFDDEPDDPSGFQPPLPPEDRLWRHPSELGPGGAASPITIVSRPVAGGRTWAVAGVAALVGAGLTFTGLTLTGAFEDETTPAAVEQIMVAPPDRPTAEALAVADQVAPTVLRVDATGPAGATSGTGVLFRTDGYVLTTADAVNGADNLTVTVQDGRALPAELVGLDWKNDVAVVKVDPADQGELPAATLGQPDALVVGEGTIVISSVPDRPRAPMIGEGLVSALGQNVSWGESGDSVMRGMIQTSVRMTVDATGAPLVDRRGAVVGIVSRRGKAAELARTAGMTADGSNGAEVWFATPIDWAKHLADQIVVHGSVVQRVWMGVDGTDLDDERADALGRGAGEIVDVLPASPAADAGLQGGDIITSIDAVPVTTWSDVIVRLRLRSPGDVVSVGYLRGGQEDRALVTLAEKRSES